ncbi:MAG: PQQ-dependent sugar dehydrogenase [Dermatophilaceae bacterium]
MGEVPALQVDVVVEGLEHGWDIGFLPGGGALVTERAGRISHLSSTEPGAVVTRVEADLSGVFASGEGGLLGMVVHPDFASSREFTVCMNYQEGGDPVDIRLVTWRLSQDARSAERVRDLLTGIPTGGGRHSGCRPTVDADGLLVVGTGDIADGSIPQDLARLGGKVLRLDLTTGEPAPDNPFVDAAQEEERYVLSYGHRNIQGVTVRPATGEIYTAEHGPRVNDEVNRIVPGGNYGWDPSQGGTVGGYDESVPMTDLERFPEAVPAIWQTGAMTEALCGAAFLEGEQWGALDGALLVTALRGAKAVLLTLDDDGQVAQVAVAEELDDEYGRLRAARLGPDGAVYVTTSNGENDKVLRVTPAAP